MKDEITNLLAPLWPQQAQEILTTIRSSPVLLATTSLVGLLTFFFTIQTFQTWYRLRHIPGPFLNGFTPLVLVYHSLKGDISDYTRDLTVKYGPLVRVTPTVVVYDDPEVMRRIASPRNKYSKGLWFEFTRWSLERYSSVAMRDDKSRKERKGKLLPAWSANALARVESRVDEQVHAFLDLIRRKYTSTPGKVRNMEFGHRAQYFTLDVTTGVTFGEPWGFLRRDGDVQKYLEISDFVMPVFGIFGAMPGLVHLTHTWPFTMLMPGDSDGYGFGALMKFASVEVDKRVKAAEELHAEEEKRGTTSSETTSLRRGAVYDGDMIGAYLANGIEPEDVVQESITLV